MRPVFDIILHPVAKTRSVIGHATKLHKSPYSPARKAPGKAARKAADIHRPQSRPHPPHAMPPTSTARRAAHIHRPQSRPPHNAYSLRNALVGFISAALTDCTLTVATAITTAIPPAAKKIHVSMEIR